MGKKVVNNKVSLKKPIVSNDKKPQRDVVLNSKQGVLIQHPVFSFEDFKMESINIKNEFNNFYKDENAYSKTITNLFGRGLKLLANENVKELIEDRNKQATIHFHQVTGKEEIIEKILKEYKYNDKKVDNILEGGNIYQFEIPYENGAARVVLQVIDNIFSLLFIDSNHHIYFNKKKVDSANSLFFEQCPLNENNTCLRMNYMETCFAFEYLDEEKIKETYGFEYNFST